LTYQLIGNKINVRITEIIIKADGKKGAINHLTLDPPSFILGYAFKLK